MKRIELFFGLIPLISLMIISCNKDNCSFGLHAKNPDIPEGYSELKIFSQGESATCDCSLDLQSGSKDTVILITSKDSIACKDAKIFDINKNSYILYNRHYIRHDKEKHAITLCKNDAKKEVLLLVQIDLAGDCNKDRSGWVWILEDFLIEKIPSDYTIRLEEILEQ